ncbi:D-glucuronyl C5-epimerase family protein [Propionibacteriaceae bacterium Y1923]
MFDRRNLLRGASALGLAGLGLPAFDAFNLTSPAMANPGNLTDFQFSSSPVLPFGQFRQLQHPWTRPVVPLDEHARIDPGYFGDPTPLASMEARMSSLPEVDPTDPGTKSTTLDPNNVPAGFSPVSLRYNPAPDQVLQADGSILYRRTDGKLIHHPTLAGTWFSKLKLSWQMTGVSSYRDAALAQGRTMRDNLVDQAGVLWATYDMPTEHHGQKLPDPWVSAFGQQRAVQVALGMHELTGDSSWVQVAEKAFAAFGRPRDPAQPGYWVTAKDSDGYLWFEGFPVASGVPTMTYNIHLTALYGLAAMFPAPFSNAHREQVRQLVFAGMATAAHYAPKVRNPQQCSFYYAQPEVDPRTHKFYHAANAGAMWTIYDRTGYAPLAWWATALARDFPVHRGGGLVWIKAGTYHLRKVWDSDEDDGRVWTVTFKVDTRLPADARQGARAGQAGANKHLRKWIRLAGGRAPGWWINEQPGRVFLEGFNVDRMNFREPMELYFEPGVKITGVSKNDRGFDRPGTEVRASWSKGQSKALCDMAATVGGRQYVRVINGVFKGKWLPTGSSVHLGPRYLG